MYMGVLWFTHCILKNDTQRLVKCFEDDEDEYKDTVAELINQRGEDGKSPLDVAATLGRVDKDERIKLHFQRLTFFKLVAKFGAL
jgi:hypothetical protein